MDDIEVLDDERDGGKTFEKFDPADYSKGVFSMFGGEKLRLSCRLTMTA